VRTTLMVSGLTVGVLVVGCGKTASHAANADLQRDLKLASTANLALATQSQTTKYALVENAPQAKPNESHSLHKGAGPKALPSTTPTVKAAPEPTLAPSVMMPQLQMISTIAAPAPTIAPVPAAVATEDLPAPVPTRATGTEGDGAGGAYPGAGSGAVIRGMGPDGDNCGPPRPGAGGQGIPLFFPPVGGVGGTGGGSGGSSGRPSMPAGAPPHGRGGGGGL
jgi:hypothetical protein